MAQPAAPARPVALIDIDSVLADVRHRLHLVERAPKDWDAFFAAASEDGALTEGMAITCKLAADHDICYLTGRPERCRRDTVQWLARHGLPDGDLVMRREGDRRPARLTKVAEARRLARSRRVAVVVDDDPAVCTALEQAGFIVFRADWMGRRSGALTTAREREGRT